MGAADGCARRIFGATLARRIGARAEARQLGGLSDDVHGDRGDRDFVARDHAARAGVGDDGTRGIFRRGGLRICAAGAGAQILVVINASPFHTGKGNEREGTMHERVQATGVPLVYAHLVGGQDEIVFEGRSFVLSADGSLAGRAIQGLDSWSSHVARRHADERLLALPLPEAVRA